MGKKRKLLIFEKIIIIGGNRYNEDNPVLKFINLCRERNIENVVFTDKERASYPTGNGINFTRRLEQENIENYVIDNVNQEFNKFKSIDSKNTAVLSINCKWIVSKEMIDYFSGRIFNYHNANLPKQRGAACHSWRLMQEDTISAITIHEMTPVLDKGKIVHSRKINFSKSALNLENSYKEIAEKEIIFFSEFLDNNFNLAHDEYSKSFYWPRLVTEKNGYINWDWTAREIVNFCAAFDKPFNGSITFLNNIRIRLRSVTIDDENINFHPFQAGLIYRLESDYVWVAAKDGGLKIGDLHTEFPVKIREGLRLITPQELLIKALEVPN